MVRVRGRLTPVEGYPVLTPTDTREIIYSILTGAQRQKLENNWQLDFAYQIPGRSRFRVNAYFQRSALGAAFRLIPFEVVPLETLGCLRWWPSSPTGPEGWCWSPAPPARGSRPRWPR